MLKIIIIYLYRNISDFDHLGMFPYTMLATTTIFYSNDWPKRLLNKLKFSSENKDETGRFIISKRSAHCVYDNDEKKEDEKSEKKQTKTIRKRTFYQKFFTLFTFLYLAEQLFLPYSHFITKVILKYQNNYFIFKHYFVLND